ncbi:hypothetical protein HKX48_001327 [Thoreauomyces humboldtii]|nr:hypothetical protein HKX48_001327 [Thoreauomyces humboldtii]
MSVPGALSSPETASPREMDLVEVVQQALAPKKSAVRAAPGAQQAAARVVLPAIQLQRGARPDMGLIGTAAVAAAEDAIRRGVERRKRLSGISADELDERGEQGPGSEQQQLRAMQLSSSRSKSITDVTNRLADPDYFPSAYKHKYEAAREHRERVAEAVNGSKSGSLVSLADLPAALSKKAEDVVKRLTDPRQVIRKMRIILRSFTGC